MLVMCCYAGYRRYSFNQLVSDRIGLRRSIPDTRHQRSVTLAAAAAAIILLLYYSVVLARETYFAPVFRKIKNKTIIAKLGVTKCCFRCAKMQSGLCAGVDYSAHRTSCWIKNCCPRTKMYYYMTAASSTKVYHCGDIHISMVAGLQYQRAFVLKFLIESPFKAYDKWRNGTVNGWLISNAADCFAYHYVTISQSLIGHKLIVASWPLVTWPQPNLLLAVASGCVMVLMQACWIIIPQLLSPDSWSEYLMHEL